MKLYNTLSRKEEDFKPTNSSEVTFYACGPTVYDETHIGHMRKYVMDDILKRTLTFLGYNVNHIMNITDVGHLSGDDDSGEDKLEKGAKKQGKTVWDVAKFYTDKFFETTNALNIERPTVVKATDHIAEMIELIKKLKKKDFTYETKEAVYFDVTKFPDYGKLSGQKLEDKKQAVREEVNIDPEKKHPADFALWFKRVGRFADHTMHWESPWGEGFPGWHIECSAMSMEALHSAKLDIHSGGIDHIPVHHENEIAQSEAATGEKPFVKYWVHHAFLKVNGEKMSKSKENFYTLKDLQDHNIDPLAIRYLFLQTHYRQEMNFTWESAQAAQNTLENLRSSIIALRIQLHDDPSLNNKTSSKSEIEQFKSNFTHAISNDLNTAEALSVMWSMLKSKLYPVEKINLLQEFDTVFGFNLKFGPYTAHADILNLSQEIKTLINQRDEARKIKDFQTSDDLRIKLEQKGLEVSDTAKGTVVVPKKNIS